MEHLVIISDTHGLHWDMEPLPKGSVLIHAGDMCNGGSFGDLLAFCLWMDEQDFKRKIVVAGNHDRCLQTDPLVSEQLLADHGIEYLKDSSTEICGMKVYGSPWQPEFCSWAFNLPREGEALKNKWAAIPDDTDILITHGPPKFILDKARDGFDCGCEHLAERVKELHLRVHIFGHIHESYSVKHGTVDCPTTFFNASICTRNYRPTNKPHQMLLKTL